MVEAKFYWNILLATTEHDSNGQHQIVLTTADKFNLLDDFITVNATNHYFDECPNSNMYGERKYTIATKYIVAIWPAMR